MTSTEALELYWQLWLRLDALPQEKFSGDEGESLRDLMEGPYLAMKGPELTEFRRRKDEYDREQYQREQARKAEMAAAPIRREGAD